MFSNDALRERIIGTTWSFGEAGKAPRTTNFTFQSDRTISGDLRGSQHSGWDVNYGCVLVLDAAGRISFVLKPRDGNDGVLRLQGFKLQPPRAGKAIEMAQIGNRAQAQPLAVLEDANPPKFDQIKMVIWDLDDTFWSGTLAEGGATLVEANVNVVRALTDRGIVNSICSKNEFARTKMELETHGLWDLFIFPRIEFAPKGEMIKSIISAAQLRPPNVLFIDDNVTNINEAKHYNPGLQVCEPNDIAILLEDERCKGKPDPQHVRLAHYKVLERKFQDQIVAGRDNLDFLRQSEICVSFHYDVMEEFPRIHDLVNRSNQLNFTKIRWSEDIDLAQEAFRGDFEKTFRFHSGYVKVADKYGSYGIVGFYAVHKKNCLHFVFSCRTLNMGIEQFVWNKIGRPKINIIGPVVSELGSSPDWITVVKDADTDKAAAVSPSTKLSVCVRGACDLGQMSHYLRKHFNTIEEFAYPYNWWTIYPLMRSVALYDELNSPAGEQMLKKLPASSPVQFESAINDRRADVYIISLTSEIFMKTYMSKSTGLIVPLNCSILDTDITKAPFSEIAKSAAKHGVSEETWDAFRNEFEKHGKDHDKLLCEDLSVVFQKLKGKLVILMGLLTQIGDDRSLLGWNDKINKIAIPIARSYGVRILDMNELVRNKADIHSMHPVGTHFSRQVYIEMARRVTTIIQQEMEGIQEEMEEIQEEMQEILAN